MALQAIVEQIVSGLGYDLVEIDRSAGGLLRITIDLPWSPPVAGVQGAPAEQFVTVDMRFVLQRDLHRLGHFQIPHEVVAFEGAGEVCFVHVHDEHAGEVIAVGAHAAGEGLRTERCREHKFPVAVDLDCSGCCDLFLWR